MLKFYEMAHNSSATRGFPWAWKIIEGLELVKVCYACSKEGRQIQRPMGDIAVELEQGRGTRWPDILGCGSWPVFIVSRRVLDDWQTDGVGTFPSNRVIIMGSLPPKLVNVPRPDYFWLDGTKMQGGKLDFEESGFVDVRFCPECGTRLDDISATSARQRTGEFPMKIVPGTWTGSNVFTTDLSPAAFFCTDKVFKSANRRKHLNFRFEAAAEE